MRLAAALLVLVLVPTAAAQAAPPQAPDKSPPEIAAYWTKDRMDNAIPRDMGRGGEPRALVGKPSKGGGSTSWTRLAVPTPYTGEDLTNGKVFMTLGGVNYVCSGTSVQASTGVNLVWTAGHCVNEGPGEYVTNFMFAPGWVDGTAPYGKWAASGGIQTTTQWRTGGDFEYDFGAARVVRPSGAPATLAAIATPRAMAFNYGVTVNSTRFKSYGYPAAGKFNGQRLYVCDSAVQMRDGADMGIGCDMTGGSSGGGWLDGSKAVSSINSYGYNSLKNVMFGPYQGSVAQSLYLSMD